MNLETEQLKEAGLDLFGGDVFPCPRKLSPGMSIFFAGQLIN